jgi:uncharacterized protein (DUF983 family)
VDWDRVPIWRVSCPHCGEGICFDRSHKSTSCDPHAAIVKCKGISVNHDS